MAGTRSHSRGGRVAEGLRPRGLTTVLLIGVGLLSLSACSTGSTALSGPEAPGVEAALPETGGTPPAVSPTPSPRPSATPTATRDPAATLAILPNQFPRATVIQKANVRACPSLECSIEVTLDVGEMVYLMGRAEESPVWVRVASPSWEGERYMHESTLTAGAPLP